MLKAVKLKQKMKKIAGRTISYRQRISLLAIIALLAGGFALSPMVRADQYDEQIKALNQQNAQNQQAASALQVQVDSYQDALNKLQAQIDVVHAQISANQAKQADLQRQITDAETELAKQKALLGEDIKQMYLDGQISTLEMLASSKDLSDFVDKQEYQTAVQDKIKDTLDKVTALKLQLKSQKDAVDQLLKDEQDMNTQLATDHDKQNELLGYTQAQKDQYAQQIKTNNANIAELRRQQFIANARFIGGTPGTGPACGGGYLAKWCEVPQDTVLDDWGMWNRECVSYTAFKVAASGRHMPYWGGYGNANQWDDNARASGIPVDGNPRAGDVAQTDAGGLGHVMYVEYVYGDGTIYISQYNAGLDGRYSEKRISAAGLNFIHFP